MQKGTDEDPRLCPSSRLFNAMHRTMLLCPVLGLAHEFEQMCLPLGRTWIAPPTASEVGNSTSEADHVFTWKAKGSRLVTIMKTGPNTTVFWDHSSGTSFKAKPCCALGPGCPVGSAFLGQVVMDRISPGEASMDPELADAGCGDKLEPWKINVLVFDILSLGSEKNFCMVPPTPPMQRYTLLRELGDEQNQRGIFTSECMKVQWAGQLQALQQFHQREGDKLAHIIDCYVRLGVTNPFEIGFLHS